MNGMRVLTVRPPWADCIAVGAKRFETRSWATAYRGPVMIHAGFGKFEEIRNMLERPEFQVALAPTLLLGASGFVYPRHVTCGAVVAVCRIEDCISTVELNYDSYRREAYLGNFQPGRFAWLLTHVVRLTRPVKCSGQLGLFRAPAELRRQVLAAMPAGVQVDPVILRGMAA
jgi:hypothetical protein